MRDETGSVAFETVLWAPKILSDCLRSLPSNGNCGR